MADSSAAAPSANAPRLERVGKSWKVENYVNDKNIVVSDTFPKQQIHIFRCENSTVQIKGKVNEILIDNCSKVSVLFEDVIASCDIVNSKRTTVQVTGSALSFQVLWRVDAAVRRLTKLRQIDRSHGVTIFLSKEAETASIFTSSAMEVNVVTSPPAGVDAPQVDHAVPQQYVSKLVNGKLITQPIQHASA